MHLIDLLRGSLYDKKIQPKRTVNLCVAPHKLTAALKHACMYIFCGNLM